LLLFLIEKVKKFHFERINLKVNTENKKEIGLYENIGFKNYSALEIQNERRYQKMKLLLK
jgi:ribosomal protein S18 acetylase RimI-like enzyme